MIPEQDPCTSDLENLCRQKAELRRQMQQKIQSMSGEELAERSRKLSQNLFRSRLVEEAELILGYSAMGHEISLRPLLNRLEERGKAVAYPRTADHPQGHMEYHLIESGRDGFEQHPYGMYEPPAGSPRFDPRTDSRKLLVLVPGLAFDSSGRRLGRGKSYYDRYLSRLAKADARIVGVCPSELLVEQVPTTPWDHRVEYICTESELITANYSKSQKEGVN
ncbi:MAG: 5-formyltetrahydrofolate cyclo-ligase [Spirochaetales bacterium]|nr:5-formyltetrahydrofolate cyclo-ligase [Spirochaetales bacterium]MCF7936988.1 5-formyltetrahydrofolate cyclo-ligase [Spirochaetales bacterium]